MRKRQISLETFDLSASYKPLMAKNKAKHECYLNGSVKCYEDLPRTHFFFRLQKNVAKIILLRKWTSLSVNIETKIGKRVTPTKQLYTYGSTYFTINVSPSSLYYKIFETSLLRCNYLKLATLPHESELKINLEQYSAARTSTVLFYVRTTVRVRDCRLAISDVDKQHRLSEFDCSQLFLLLCSGTWQNEKDKSFFIFAVQQYLHARRVSKYVKNKFADD